MSVPPAAAEHGASEARLADGICSPTLVARLHQSLMTEGGFTLDLRSARPVVLGLAVCADPTRALRFRLGEWSDRLVLDWLRAITTDLGADRHDGLCIGGWHPPGSGIVHLDLVRVVPTERRLLAERLGRHHGQHALFDLTRRALVPLVVT